MRIEYDRMNMRINLLSGDECIASMDILDYTEAFGAHALIELVRSYANRS